MAIAIPLAATKELIADVAELKGLYIFRYIKGRQLPRLLRAVGIFGFHILSRICVGYIVGLTKEKVFKDNYLYHMSAIATITFILRFVYWWLELLRSGGRWSIFFAYLWDSLGYIIGNALLVWPVVVIMKMIYEWIRKEDISY